VHQAVDLRQERIERLRRSFQRIQPFLSVLNDSDGVGGAAIGARVLTFEELYELCLTPAGAK
jgi:hypothetical protein